MYIWKLFLIEISTGYRKSFTNITHVMCHKKSVIACFTKKPQISFPKKRSNIMHVQKCAHYKLYVTFLFKSIKNTYNNVKDKIKVAKLIV